MTKEQKTYPPGQSKIERENASVFAPLIHETHAGSEIQRSGFLSAMNWSGGINFTIGQRGGYRPLANMIITISAQQLVDAIDSGIVFFHNQFSDLVFGAGKLTEDGSWDGMIPQEFFTISSLSR